MAINESISVNEDGNSEVSKVLNSQSIVHVSGVFKGKVFLQIAPDGTDNWISILTFLEPGSFPISTPDLTMDYRFYCDLTLGTVNLYLGE